MLAELDWVIELRRRPSRHRAADALPAQVLSLVHRAPGRLERARAGARQRAAARRELRGAVARSVDRALEAPRINRCERARYTARPRSAAGPSRAAALSPRPATRTRAHAEGRHSHPRRTRQAQGRARATVDQPRREVAARIKEAREFGDISENAEYDDAKNEQAMLEARIACSRRSCAGDRDRADELVDRVVRVGSVVHVKDEKTGKSARYTIVGSAEAKPAENKLSNESPVGQGAGRPQAQRDRLDHRTPRARAQAQDHEDRVGLSAPGLAGGPADETSRGAPRDRSSPPGAAKLERLRAAGVEPFPHRFPASSRSRQCAPRTPGSRRARRPTSRIASRGGCRAPRPGQDGLSRPRRPFGADAAAGPRRRAREERIRAAAAPRPRRSDRGRRDGVRTRRGELTLRVTGYALLAKSLRPPPDKHHGLTDVETRFRQREARSDRQRGGPRAVHHPRRGSSRAVRRLLDDAGFIEVETPILQPLYGGARGAAVHDPPQRARPRAVPAHRHRAVPQAPDRRRP